MTPRPFHRSRLFWLGLPGLIFLTWVWLGTRHHLAWVQKGTPAALVLFGTDSSFFPRGWNRPVFDAQFQAVRQLGVPEPDIAQIFGGNFDRLFPSVGG